ncbi:hypothetical protein LPN04_29405 [Rugamonas sp. A1-17]|nr:hypothetical protein [Rugamonas sp. A1-17]
MGVIFEREALAVEDARDAPIVPMTPSRWNRALLAAMQSDRQVIHRGEVCRLSAVCFQLDGSSVSGTAYLDGRTGDVEPTDLLFQASDACSVIVDIPAAQHHERVILHALQTAYPLRYGDLSVFVHTLHLSFTEGECRTKVYLAGYKNVVAPELLTKHPRPAAVLQVE